MHDRRAAKVVDTLGVSIANDSAAPAATESARLSIEPADRTDVIVVVERRDLVRACLTCWLDAFCKQYAVAAVSDIEQSLDAAALSQATSVLIGIGSLEQGDAWLHAQVAVVRARRPDVPILVIVEADEVSAAEAVAIRLGLQGYVPTSSSAKVAAAALHLVIAGGRYFPFCDDRATPQVRCDPGLPTIGTDMIATLTERELAVLAVLQHGTQNKLIAYRLGISLSTVKAHVHSVIRKLHVRNRTEAVVAARKLQWRAPGANGNVSSAAPPAIHVQGDVIPVPAHGNGTERLGIDVLSKGPRPAARARAGASLSVTRLEADVGRA